MESKSKKLLAVIIPMYNEENVAERCLRNVLKEIRKEKSKCSLIVVNDGSKDRTRDILDNWQRKEKDLLLVIHHKKNKGYGGALKTGINEAVKMGFEFCLTMDSDLTNDPKYIHAFIDAGNQGYDCVKASRYISGSKVINVPLYRIIISSFGNMLASILFNVGIKDCTNGFRMARISRLKGLTFKENNFSIILEELYYLKKKGSSFYEIPYTLTARTDSRSHFSYKPKIFFDYFKYAILACFVRY